MSSEDRKNSNTFLADLRNIIKEVLANKEIEDYADAVISRLVELWGGEQVYVLKNTSLREELKARNLLIYRKFNGRNHHAICREFSISNVQLHNIVRRMRAEMQRDLFKE